MAEDRADTRQTNMRTILKVIASMLSSHFLCTVLATRARLTLRFISTHSSFSADSTRDRRSSTRFNPDDSMICSLLIIIIRASPNVSVMTEGSKCNHLQ